MTNVTKKKYRENNQVKIRLYNRAYRQKDGVKYIEQERHLRKRYGIDINIYNQMLEKQNGGCAICGGQTTNGRNLYIDHDHKSGVIRGLLCNRCNSGIGLLNDDVEIIKRALLYLGQTL